MTSLINRPLTIKTSIHRMLASPPDGGGAQPPLTPPPEPSAQPSPEPRRQRLSEILNQVIEDPQREWISVGDLVKALHIRALAAMLLIFALPNALPAIPGTSAILGLPLLYLTFQMMLGRTPWLPKFISERSMSRTDMQKLVGKMTPWLERAERLLAPRWSELSTPTAERFLGGLCLALAIVLFLPIPLGNMLPAFAISVIAFGLLEKDGVWIACGVVAGIIGLLVVAGVVLASIKIAALFIAHLFS